MSLGCLLAFLLGVICGGVVVVASAPNFKPQFQRIEEAKAAALERADQMKRQNKRLRRSLSKIHQRCQKAEAFRDRILREARR